MSEKGRHYFSADLPHKYAPRFKLDFTSEGLNFVFWTSPGTFSPKAIDAGSYILLNHIDPPKNGRILDLGAGYGLLGIVILKKWPDNDLHMTFIEVNPAAGKLIKKNLAENNCPQSEIIIGDFLEHQFETPFDYVVCNPPLKRGLRYNQSLFNKVASILNSGGKFQFVAKSALGAKRLRDYLTNPQLQFSEITEQIKAGYRVVSARRKEKIF